MADRNSAGSKATGRAMTALLVFLALCLGIYIFDRDNFYLWAKAIHIMAVIAWMAGMFYLPRLFVYHADTAPGSESSETFKVMEYRLMKAIMNPAMILTWIFGLYLAWEGFRFSGGWLHVKKAQFLAPWDCKNIVTKVAEVTGDKRNPTILCERGASFGYNNLVVDMLGIPAMKALDVPVTIDATHAVQLPGADPRTSGGSTGGRREGVSIIAQSAIAAGADGVFLEFHEEPDKALCDGPSCLDLQTAEPLLARLKAIREIVSKA